MLQTKGKNDPKIFLEAIVMQIEKVWKNDCLGVSEIYVTFNVPTIYNFVAIHPWNLLFSEKVAYFSTISIVFSVYKQNFMA